MSRGQLTHGRLTQGNGTEVHAASFLRQRLIILDRELLRSPEELGRIWRHELLHFVWWRLANQTRRSWEDLLFRERSRGELGYSAQWRKNLLTKEDLESRTRHWREYCSESFCDTGAWIAAGQPAHPEATLSRKWRALRCDWWRDSIRYNSSGRTQL